MGIPPIDIKTRVPGGGEKAFGGGLEGADRLNRETALWSPPIITPDQQIELGKTMADVRARDSVQNNGYAMGALSTHKDSIVGANFRLNSRPDWKALRYLGFNADAAWAEEFQEIVERVFNLIAESPNCYLDASGLMTLTEQVRMSVGCFVINGESIATAEWLRGAGRPIRTAMQIVSPDRLCNPDNRPDSRLLRRGIKRDLRGRPLSYYFKTSSSASLYAYGAEDFKWTEVPREKPWGRRQVVHCYMPMQPDQSRGISDMVSVLKQMHMTRKFQDVTLQNAVINASYAAAIESEIPYQQLAEQMGANPATGTGADFNEMAGGFLAAMQSYLGGGDNVRIDGAKIPVLFPNTKLNLKPVGTPGGVGSAFEESLLRHTAAGLGMSYEQFSRDYSNTNYSSARASMAETEKYMASRKKAAADAYATNVFHLVLEELVNLGNLPLPGGMRPQDFYAPLVKDALGQCSWIGAGKGSIDRLKETQAAVLAVNSGLSTREAEIARLGDDFREVFEQLSREKAMADRYGLSFSSDATRPGSNAAQQILNGGREQDADED